MSVFRMPSLGADMEAGTLIEWLKQPGETVSRGEVVAVVETQKGAIEIEVFSDGRLARHLAQPGTKLPVGAPLAEIDDGESAAAAPPTPAPTAIPTAAPTPTPPTAPVPGTAAPAAAPLPAGRKVSPAARKLAADNGIDLAGIAGTGPEGAVQFVDVEAALRAGKAAAAAPQRAAGPDLGEMRKAIAAAMAQSKREIPHYYLSHTADLARSTAWLAQTNAARPPAARLLLGALSVKAVAQALGAMPEFNGFFVDGRFQPGAGIHIGMAIAIRGGGLVAPAILDADRLSVDAVMDTLRDLTARVRGGRLRSSEMNAPTVTISSLGERGADALFGIIQPPQVALVGFGSPHDAPRAVDGAVAVRPVMTITLAGDHRVTDGHRGALVLARIAELLQTPERL
jgi:pyruvate dehydrogenase E2 component (dihydrolipoamide acetyltransferase)